MRRSVWILLSALVLSGCSSCPQRASVDPNLSQPEVLSIAAAALAGEGVDLGTLQQPTVSFESNDRSCQWALHYYAKSEIIGTDVTVLINDRTRQVDVFGAQ